jgi:hypothetical protein
LAIAGLVLGLVGIWLERDEIRFEHILS